MAGFKQGGIEFKQKSVIGSPTTSEHIIVYWNDINDLIIKTSSGEDVIATESLIASISSDLQFQIDNLSGDFLGLTDTPSTYVGSNTYVVTVSGNSLTFTPQSEIIPTLTEASLSGALDGRYVNVAGDTMTGQLEIGYTGADILNLVQGNSSSSVNLKVGNSTNQLTIGSDSSTMFIDSIGSGATLEIRRGNTTRMEFTGPNVIFGTNTTKVEIQKNTSSTSISTGALVVPNGGVGIGENLNVGGNANIDGTLTVSGNIVQISGGGYFTQIAETVQIQDNLVVLNYGETGNGISLKQSGVQIDRGTADDYFFMFDETIDNGTFVIGVSGDFKPVATREINPINGAFAFWNDAERRFDTSSQYTSGAWDALQTQSNGITGGISQLDDRFVNVTGDTMTGSLTLSGGLKLPNLITIEENIIQIDSQGNVISSELQESFVQSDDIVSSSTPGTKGQWSFGGGYYYSCVADDTWVKYAVIIDITSNVTVLEEVEITGDLTVTSLISVEDNFLTVDNTGKLVDSGFGVVSIAGITNGITQLDATYVNVDGDTMTGDLTINGADVVITDLITDEENVAQVDDNGAIITTELQELYVPVEDVTGPNATGIKGQWSYGLGYYYKCVATNTWVKYAVVTSW